MYIHNSMCSVVIPSVFICLHMCVLEAIVGYLCFQGKYWNEAVKPVAVTDHLLCSFSTLLVFSKQFPLQHTQRASHLPIFYAVVAHSCCTVLITYKEKPAYISKGEDESGLIICNVWVPFIGTEQKEKEEMVATVNSKKSSHPLNCWLYGREFGSCCQSHCVFNSSWAALLASKWDYWKHKPVSDDRVTEREKNSFQWCVRRVICYLHEFSSPPVIKTAIKADTLPHKSTQEMIFFFFFVISIW